MESEDIEPQGETAVTDSNEESETNGRGAWSCCSEGL